MQKSEGRGFDVKIFHEKKFPKIQQADVYKSFVNRLS